MDEAPRHDDAEPGYERKDLSPRSIAFFGVTLTVSIGLVVTVVTVFQMYSARRYVRRQPPRPPITVTRESGDPQLQVNGPAELRAMREAEDAALNTYGWLNRDAGTVRIPVDRAIEILAQKGLPARQEQGEKQQPSGNRSPR